MGVTVGGMALHGRVFPAGWMLSSLEVSADRRGARRIPVQLRVKLKDLGRPGEAYEEVTRDVSSGGVFVETSVAFEEGTTVEVEVEARPSGPPIRFLAEVVRIEEEPGALGSVVTMGMRSRGLALRLSGANPDALLKLLDEVKKMQSDGTDPFGSVSA